jgi:hypothetical protein
MLVIFAADGSADDTTAGSDDNSAGWTLLFQGSAAGGPGDGAANLWVFYKRVEAGEPAQVFFSHDGSARPMTGAILVYRGVSTTGDAVDDDFIDSDVGITSIDAQVTPTVENTMLVAIYATALDSSVALNTTYSGTLTERVNVTSTGEEMRLAASDVLLGRDELTDNIVVDVDPATPTILIFQLFALTPAAFEEETYVDNYKAKVMRRMLPPPYDNRLSSQIGKLVSVIGTSDNDIGGLFGDADFLPDEEA